MSYVVLDAEPPGIGIIELLQELTAQAKAGELSSIAVAIVFRDGSADQRWSFAPSGAAQIGSAAMLVHRLSSDNLE